MLMGGTEHVLVQIGVLKGFLSIVVRCRRRLGSSSKDIVGIVESQGRLETLWDSTKIINFQTDNEMVSRRAGICMWKDK